MEQRIDAILMDLGGTLRRIRKDAAYQRQARSVITHRLGVSDDPDEFYERVIKPRCAAYRQWAQTYCCEAPVHELWTRWLAHDYPKARVLSHAAELTWALRCCKGERVVVEGGAETVRELCRRGYTLGIISDLVGTDEIEDWLRRDGLRECFQTVQQSSVSLVRKPHPAMFYHALAETGAAPKRACYVGNDLNKDVIGAKRAGLGMTVAVQYPDAKAQAVTEENRPDRFITHFTQLLNLFPPLNRDKAVSPAQKGDVP